RQHEVVVFELLARNEAQTLPGPVDLGGARPSEVIDPMIAVKRLRPHQQQVEADLAVEIVLRQRRPLIRQHRLLAEQDDCAVEPALAQRGGQLKPGMPGADDDHPFLCHYPATLDPSSRRKPGPIPASVRAFEKWVPAFAVTTSFIAVSPVIL